MKMKVREGRGYGGSVQCDSSMRERRGVEVEWSGVVE
jgi:hypothetical protein